MLIVNGTILNLGQPTTDLEIQVKKQMAELKKEYGLNEGKAINFVYPKEYLRVNKANGGKIDRPASFKITFRDFFGDGNGTSEWRWCTGTQSPDGRNPIYFPKFYLFTGSWTLTEKDIDLIYYLLYIYSRTKGGKNITANTRPYLAIEDVVKDAGEVVALRKRKSFVESAILNDEEEGGLPEGKLRVLALSLLISNADVKDIDLLRRELLDIVDLQKGGYELIKKAYDEQNSGIGEFRALTQQLLDAKIIELQTRGTTTAYYFVDADGKIGSKITNIKKNQPNAEQFAKYLSEDADTVDILTKALEIKRGSAKEE